MLKAVEADEVLQPPFWEAALVEMDVHSAMRAVLEELLTARSTKLSELRAKNGEPGAKRSRVKAQSAIASTVSDDLKLVAGTIERSMKRAKVARTCEVSSTTLSTAAVSAPLTELEKYKNSCDTLALQNQCILEPATEAKKLREK